jgi:hypothetical protein
MIASTANEQRDSSLSQKTLRRLDSGFVERMLAPPSSTGNGRDLP